jgi:cold shock CspA family protein/ribosome-associated translation inhibitor RaiA
LIIMQLPLQVTFRNMEPSEFIERAVREKAERLNRYFPRIMSCRVIVEAPHRHHLQGKLYHVRIDIGVPGEELVVAREPSLHRAHRDVYVAIRDAFRAARRELMDHARRFRREVKTHAGPTLGRVVHIEATGFGFLETTDGREIYFHANSVLSGGFERLAVGDTVRFVEEQGIEGPQASTVVPAAQRTAPS